MVTDPIMMVIFSYLYPRSALPQVSALRGQVLELQAQLQPYDRAVGPRISPQLPAVQPQEGWSGVKRVKRVKGGSGWKIWFLYVSIVWWWRPRFLRWRFFHDGFHDDSWWLMTWFILIFGGFHQWRYPFIAGWFISWKIPSINGWWLGVTLF